MATVDKRGKRYRVRYAIYENGKRIQRNKSFPTAREAKEFAAKVEYDIDTGQYAYTKGRTLADVLNEWLEVYCTHLRPNALADMKTAVKVHIIPHLGNVPLKSVTTGMIQKFYNDMMKTEWKPAVYKEVKGLQVLVSPAKTYSAKTVHNVVLITSWRNMSLKKLCPLCVHFRKRAQAEIEKSPKTLRFLGLLLEALLAAGSVTVRL